MRPSSINLLGVRVDDLTGDELLLYVERAVRHGEKRIFAYLTIHGINLAQKIPWFKGFLQRSDIAYADGEGVRWGVRVLGESLSPRIPLTRWVWSLAQFCETNGFSLYLLGSTDDSIRKACAALRSKLNNLNIVGQHNGYFEKDGLESERVVENINASAPNILLVGFGMPDQEKWIEQNVERLRVNVIMPSGSCFDFVGGGKSSSPEWMSRNGLEWLHRLSQEPGRLFGRYVLGIPLFFLRVCAQRALNGKAVRISQATTHTT